MNLFYLLYFTSFNFLFSFIIGSIINKLLPKFDNKKKNSIIIIELIIQTFILILSVYFIRFLITKIPNIYNVRESMSEKNFELADDIIIALVFITTQDHYIKKINFLQDEFFPIK